VVKEEVGWRLVRLMVKQPVVEIICTGNELLIGKTVNTNASWMARRVTSLGGRVRRITVVGDQMDEVASIVKEAMGRRPNIIITSGGLGPTFDDITLKGVAEGCGLSLELNREAYDMVKAKYDAMGLELTPSRVKMAYLPRGAKALSNPIGTAPGSLLTVNDVTIVSLPGVPREMEAMFELHVVPLLKSLVKGLTFYEAAVTVKGMLESSLAPLIEEVMRGCENVYIKSHPKGHEGGSTIELHVSAVGAEGEVRKAVFKALEGLKEAVKVRGGILEGLNVK